MTIDASELGINVLYYEIQISSQWYKKGFMIFLTVTLPPFMKYHSTPL